uniref:TATA box-binding protein-associated factor RNA polymerase I subunit B n=1 Tax=Culex pipiens TaxID=7175 RepID=A0A8D8NY04_CULPI
MADACEVCGLNEFTAEAGFFYCVECGTKSQRGQEMVDDFHEGADQGPKVKITAKPKKKLNRITSWEQANYILLGYTDLLGTLGAGASFKLTVLQLWTTYLRRMEIAFFDKEAPELPRLPVFYHKADAAIIYNRKRAPSVRSSGASSASSRRTRTSLSTVRSSHTVSRQLRQEQRDLLTAEHDSFLASQRSDVNRSLHELSIRSLNASRSGADTDEEERGKPKRIRYSRVARKHMKRKIGVQKEHIDKHENDLDGEMTCCITKELFLPNGRKMLLEGRSGKPQSLTRSLLVSMLGLALNVDRSQLQLADLVRLNREEHIPHANLMQYLPDELDPDCYTETIRRLQASAVGSHIELRETTADLSIFMKVEIVTPDWHALCKRYLAELCLPADLMIYIDRLLAIFPPQLKFNETKKIPNYEGRAMAIIIFVLKLLFGLNDSTEKSISKSAAKLNRRLTALGTYKPLFVFTEWARYIEMRKIILSQVNHHINRQVASESGITPDPTLFIDSNLRKKRNVDSFMVNKRIASAAVINLKQVVTQVVDTNHRQAGTNRTDVRSSIDFEASLTPFKSYLETFLLAYAKASPVHVPEFMYVDHSDRTVIPFIEPANFREQLTKHHQIRLIIKRAKSGRDKFHYQENPPNNPERKKWHNNVSKVTIIPEDPNWTLKRIPPPLRTHEEMLAKIIIENSVEAEQTRLVAPPQARIPDETSFLSESLFSSQTSGAGSTESSPSKPFSSLTLLCPNYECWLRQYSETEATQASFDKQVAHMLPESFRLVLGECARVVENNTHTLFVELLRVENYFCYAVEPVERWFFAETGGEEGDEHEVKVQFRTQFRSKLGEKFVEDVIRAY